MCWRVQIQLKLVHVHLQQVNSLERGNDLVLFEVLKVVVMQTVRTRLRTRATTVLFTMETQLQVLSERQSPRLGSDRLDWSHLLITRTKYKVKRGQFE